MPSRNDLVFNEALAHAQEQCHAYRSVIRNDRIALAHWSNVGVDESLKVTLKEHIQANLQRLMHWEQFLVACSQRKFFDPTIH